MSEFETLEAKASVDFILTGEVSGLLALADLCDETGKAHYATMLRELAAAATLHAGTRFFCEHGYTAQDPRRETFAQAKLATSARAAWWESRADIRLTDGSWRFTWEIDQDTDHGGSPPLWVCNLASRYVPGNQGSVQWHYVDSLCGIDLGDSNPNLIPRSVFGDPYCRVVQAQIAQSAFQHVISMLRTYETSPDELPAWIEPEKVKSEVRNEYGVARLYSSTRDPAIAFPEWPSERALADNLEGDYCTYFQLANGYLFVGYVRWDYMVANSVPATKWDTADLDRIRTLIRETRNVVTIPCDRARPGYKIRRQQRRKKMIEDSIPF